MYRTMYRSAVGIIACPVAAAWPFHFGKNCSQSGQNVRIPVDFLKPPDSGHFWTACRTAAIVSKPPEMAAWPPLPAAAHPPRLSSRTLSTSPGAARFPRPPLPPKNHENGWVGVFGPSDSEYGIAVARFRVPVPESAQGVAVMLPPLLPSFLHNRWTVWGLFRCVRKLLLPAF